MEQGLHTQVLMISRKDLKLIAETKNKNKTKFKFQGQFARSQHWCDLDFDCVQVNFTTCEPYLYKRLYRAIRIHNIEINLNPFKLPQEIQNVWKFLSFTMMPQ